jgi:hypothetical protein
MAFFSVPESSEEAQCSWGPISSTTVTSCPLPTGGCSDWSFCSSHLIANLPVYQCAKFGALNQRIKKSGLTKFDFTSPSGTDSCWARFYIAYFLAF